MTRLASTLALALRHLAGLVAEARELGRRRGGPALLEGIRRILLAALGLASMLGKWQILGVLATPDAPDRSRFDVLDRAIRAAPPGGLWLEFGVFEGRSINHLAGEGGRPVFGFDSFEGLPRTWNPLSHGAGRFSLEGRLPQVAANVELVVGRFDATLPGFLSGHPGEPVSLLHVDSDLYESARTVLDLLEPRLAEGTIIVFDEYVGGMPDDEHRAFRELVDRTGIDFRYLASSIEGSVAVRLIGRRAAPPRSPAPLAEGLAGAAGVALPAPAGRPGGV